jgi:hypothetical protein
MTKFLFKPWLSVNRSSFSFVDAETVAEIWDSLLMHVSEITIAYANPKFVRYARQAARASTAAGSSSRPGRPRK